ncbi:MAG TPA: MFS transporter [Alicyclobacillus sp.]|nr:MFS transporter [Alicyclobacillus sp.]
MESNGMPRGSLEKAGQSHGSAAHRWLVFISVVIGTFMVNVDSSIVNVAVPVLQRDFHVGPGALQWVISGYLLVVTATLPMIGGMSDRTDRRTCYIAGVTVFSLGSALCAWSTDVDQLIVFRLVQALGGAAIMGNVMSIISYTFPAGQRGRPLAWWPTTVGMAIATAALLWIAGFGSGTSKPAVVAAQALFGLGMGLFTAPNNVSILESVPVAQTGLIGSLLATIRNFGRVSGVALAVVLLETAIGTSSHYSESALVIGSRIAFGSAAILGAVATLLISTRMAASSKTTVI